METPMATQQAGLVHAVRGDTLADILERILDKGVVIAGDIRIKLVDVELLTIQIRLMIASVDKAKELGMDWWRGNPYFASRAVAASEGDDLDGLKSRIERLEAKLATVREAAGA